jgi:hypothetical protein
MGCLVLVKIFAFSNVILLLPALFLEDSGLEASGRLQASGGEAALLIEPDLVHYYQSTEERQPYLTRYLTPGMA